MTTTLAQSGLSALGREGSDAEKRTKRLQVVIFGTYGTWKTVTAHHMPNTRTLDFDDGMQSVEWAILAGKLGKSLDEIVYETLKPKANTEDEAARLLNVACDQVDQWIAEEDIPPEEWDKPYPQFWDTLIIDSASFMNDMAIGLALKENKRVELSKSLDAGRKGVTRKNLDRGFYIVPMRVQDWGSAGKLFMNAIHQWKGLGKNLIILCHEYEKTDEEGNVLAVQPLLIGQLREKLPANFDEVWYAKIKGQKADAVAVFQTKPDSRRECKTRLGCIAAEETGDFDAIKKKVSDFYKVPMDRLWIAYHGSEGRARAEAELAKETISI